MASEKFCENDKYLSHFFTIFPNAFKNYCAFFTFDLRCNNYIHFHKIKYVEVENKIIFTIPKGDDKK